MEKSQDTRKEIRQESYEWEKENLVLLNMFKGISMIKEFWRTIASYFEFGRDNKALISKLVKHGERIHA